MSRIEEIEVRMREIGEAVNAEDADLNALNSELDALSEERSSLMAEIEQRNKIIDTVKNLPEQEEKPIVEERKSMEKIEVRNSEAYINAYADYIRTEDATECRSLLSENVSDGVVAVPDLVADIVKTAWDKEGIMSLVKKSYIKGNLKVGFEISADGAVIHTEGAAAPSEEKLVLGTVNLVPASIKKWITVSDEVMDLRGSAFLQYVYEEVAYQIAKKAADDIIADIEACGTVSTNTPSVNVGVPKVTESTIAMGTIAKAIAQLSDEAANPTIVMNKQTWANFKAVQYANGYGADPFEGLNVVFNNTVKAFSVATTGESYCIVGDFGQGALANFPAGQEITFKFDDKSLAEKDLVKIVGREYVAHAVVAPKAFCKICK